MSKQDYGTPADFLDAVARRFGRLDVDLAATAADAKAPVFVTPEQDSFTVSWSDEFIGSTMWLNPPFANLGLWARKCSAEAEALLRGRILMLSPAAVGSNWFAQHVHRKAMVLALSPRITFVGETHPYPKDLILSVYGAGLWGFDVWRWK
jgi:phage N-6-adenine-methyltransferase